MKWSLKCLAFMQASVKTEMIADVKVCSGAEELETLKQINSGVHILQ